MSQIEKSILLSKRANVYYLEFARVQVKDGRVMYFIEGRRGEGYDEGFAIPDRNLTFLLLGKGTSITQAAVRMLTESDVVIGFCGSFGTPLISGVDPVFFEPKNEYRPTEYMQKWSKIFFDEKQRLSAAKKFYKYRIERLKNVWSHKGIQIPDKALEDFERKVSSSNSTEDLLAAEARWAKGAYAHLARIFGADNFVRTPGKPEGVGIQRLANEFLDHGNYLAYGYAAVALYALGISFAFPVFHGKTRRGGLVFDVADLFKDSHVLPNAFIAAHDGVGEQEYRELIVKEMREVGIIDEAINFIKSIVNGLE